MNAAWWQPTWLIARREMDERFRAKSFRIVTVLLMVAVGAGVVIPALVGKHHKTEKVGVLGAAAPALTQAAQEAGRLSGSQVSVVPVASVDDARKLLRAGTLAAVVVNGREVLVKQQQVGGTNSSSATFAGTLAQLVGLERKLAPGASAAALTNGVALPVRGVQPAPKSVASRVTAVVIDLLIYIVIFFYGLRIAQAVGEEKTSRVVEVLLATVRSTQLLTGKLIGFAALAFTQIFAAGATYAILGLAVGSHTIEGGVALMGALWLVLGFALYCTAFAAAGSMVTRQSDVGNVATPLMIPLILAYILAQGVVFGGASSFFHVLAFIPWTAPIAMPTLYAIGAASALQVVISAVLCILATIATARLAGLVYQRSVMRTDKRVKLREVLRADAV